MSEPWIVIFEDIKEMVYDAEEEQDGKDILYVFEDIAG